VNIKVPLDRSKRYLKGLALPLAAAIMMALPTTSFAGFYLSVNVAPPPLPYYEQPPIPGDGYIWVPGYWAYSDDGYFWVPGTWVLAPYEGALWTPGYWGWSNGYYVFRPGYWGPHIGYYGGINYGYGYFGIGYEGGYWNHGAFFYNRGINNFGTIRITNVYNRTVVNNFTANSTRTSFSGGAGGVMARPTPEQMQAERERHTPPVEAQAQHVEAASHNTQLFASVNHGEPAIAATQKPGEFAGQGVVRAHPLRDEERAAVAKAEQAKPVGAPVSSAREMMNGRGPDTGPKPEGRGPVTGPRPEGRGPDTGPKPEGRGPVNGPQPEGRGPVSGPQPEGRGPVNGPQPEGRGPVYGPQPQGRGPMNGPRPNQPQPRAVPPRREPGSSPKTDDKKDKDKKDQ